MPKLRKLRQSKTYSYGVNRKRLNKKVQGMGKIKCPEIKKAWEDKRSIKNNLSDMGLVYDANKAIKMPNNKQDRLRAAKIVHGFIEEEIIEENTVRPKQYVADAMEDVANEEKVKKFRLPKGQVKHLIYLMDKYGLDYKAMAKDRKNYDQETWNQIRAKIKQFVNIPEQFNVYLAKKEAEGADMEKFKECSLSDIE